MHYKNIHFIGIGGIGMSALAQMMRSKGVVVSGSDTGHTLVTEKISERGIIFFPEQKATNISNEVEAVVYTLAIPEDNPEFSEAKKRGLPMFTYAEFLGNISKEYKVIAVSGTHGKTTTTAMAAKVLKDSQKDPTVIVGSLLKEGGSNFVGGHSEFLVVEACEYKRSFLNFYPYILIITNIEEDHLDYYKDLTDIQSAFHELVSRVPHDGYVITDLDDPKISPILKNCSAQVIDYKKYLTEVHPGVPGDHNRKNAACTMSLLEIFNLNKEAVQKSLAEFTGTWRRFEYKGTMEKGGIVYDDYAHHPSEIRATILGAKEKFPDKEIIAFFEPHLYSRTKNFLNEFAESLALANQSFILPIYAAREKLDPEIAHTDLVSKIKELGSLSADVSSLDEAILKIKKLDSSDKVFVLLGAGDIYKASSELSYL